MRARFFHDMRLSTHFVMSDFLQSPALYNSRMSMTLADVTPEHKRNGMHLCALLEDLMVDHGPVSVAAGFCPRRVLGNGHPDSSPHAWDDRKASADVSFHHWVNKGKAPIELVKRMDTTYQFHRMITYAGSEFICVTAERKSGGAHRHAVFENLRQPGQPHKFIRWASSHSQWNFVRNTIPERPDWRRDEHERPSNSPELRSHHIRVGQFFTLLDFCRSPYAYESGKPWVIPPGHEPQTAYARQAAEILDPLVQALGRVSVIRGLMPRSLADREETPEIWTWRSGVAAVEVLFPQHVDPNQALDVLGHKAIEQITAYELEAGMSFRIEWRPFKPRKTWVSHYQPKARGRVLGLT